MIEKVVFVWSSTNGRVCTEATGIGRDDEVVDAVLGKDTINGREGIVRLAIDEAGLISVAFAKIIMLSFSD